MEKSENLPGWNNLPRADSGIDIDRDHSALDSHTYKHCIPDACSSTTSTDHTEEEDTERKTWKQIYCPPRGWLIKWCTWALVMLAILGALWSVIPEEMSPHHQLFGLVVTIILCIGAEQLVVKLPTPRGFPPLPPLFASLVMGLALRNLPYPANIANDIHADVSSVLRKLSLTVILTRAGLEIDAEAMRKVKWAVIRLAFLPCLAETLCIGVFAHFILNFPFIWSFMMGFMIAAVSPAVVIPSLIILQDVGFGVAKGIPSLVMAASGIDDVLAITGFTILLGIAIPSGLEKDIIHTFINLAHPKHHSSPNSDIVTTQSPMEMTTIFNSSVSNLSFANSTSNLDLQTENSNTSDIGIEIAGAVVEIVIGVLAGLILGLLITYIPFNGMRFKNFCRGTLLLGIGIFFVFATAIWEIPGSGTLCALVMSFTASLHWKEETKPLAQAWHYMWVVFQPILFGLTGTLVEFSQMDGTTVGLGLATLGISLIGRLITSTAVTFGLNLNLKERLFVSVSWIPKGTVQAALGSAALDQAVALDKSDQEKYWATQILVLAVLITLITAPIGAFGISLAGPRLLSSNRALNPQNNDAFVESDSQSSCNNTDADSMRNSSEKEKGHYPGLQLKVKDPSVDVIADGTQVTVF